MFFKTIFLAWPFLSGLRLIDLLNFVDLFMVFDYGLKDINSSKILNREDGINTPQV